MRALALGILCIGVAGFALNARADEFGPRFQTEAPVALADNAYDVQSIEPAAGDDIDALEGEYPEAENRVEDYGQYRDYQPLPTVIEQ